MKVLKSHRKENPIVLDPFCGRGTTLYAAREMGLIAWGIDSSPIAVAIAKAKLANCEPCEPLSIAESIINERTVENVPDSKFFRSAYHRKTLIEICALRDYFLEKQSLSDAEVILRAAVLGCLHGPLPKKSENAGYFSNQMPRTYASKPDYAVRFWKTRGMKAPRFIVLDVLKKKINRLVQLSEKPQNLTTQVLLGDSRSPELFGLINAIPSIVVTSPPYYGMRSYVQDQWLRNWFMGGPDRVDYSHGLQVDHGGQEAFAESLSQVWRNVSDLAPTQTDLHMYVRFGVIPSIKSDAKSLLLESLQTSGIHWRVVSTRSAASADAGKRQAEQMKTESTAAIEYDFHVVRI